MPSLNQIKIKFVFVLFVVGAWIGCSDSPPVAPRPAGKATCALCDFLGDEKYTAGRRAGAHRKPRQHPDRSRGRDRSRNR